MDHVCAGRGLRLSFVRDPGLIDDIVQDRNPDAPPIGTLASLALTWAVRRRPRSVNHLVLATDSRTGQHEGFLVAHDCTTAQEPFLLLETALTCAPADRLVVLRRMVALTILRLIGFGQPLSVVAARTRTPALCNALYDLSRHVAASTVFPEPGSNVVSLPAAALGHRVARAAGEVPRFDSTASAMAQAGAGKRGQVQPGLAEGQVSAVPLLAVLDLRAARETAVIDGARWLYRSRRPRTAPSPVQLHTPVTTSPRGRGLL